jgi:hypothetical protein
VVRRKSVPRAEQEGHLHAHFPGPAGIRELGRRPENATSVRRTILTFDIKDRFPTVVRIVGRR